MTKQTLIIRPSDGELSASIDKLGFIEIYTPDFKGKKVGFDEVNINTYTIVELFKSIRNHLDLDFNSLLIKDNFLDVTLILKASGEFELYKGKLQLQNLLYTCTINLNTFTIEKLFNEIGYLYLMEGRK